MEQFSATTYFAGNQNIKMTLSDIQFLTGEKLWNRKVIEFVRKNHYEAIYRAIQKSNTLESSVLQRSYHLDSVHQIYRLNMNANMDEEAEKCFEIIQKGANLCIENNEFTLDQMEPYLESDIERYTKLIEKCPDLSKCSILIERHIQEKNINKEQLIKLTIPIHVLNYFTNLSSKSIDIYTKLDAEKLLLTKVRLQMKQFNKKLHHHHNKQLTLNDMTWIDYLVLFVEQIIKLLKKCITHLFNDNKLFYQELQLSNEYESETHYNLLMYSTEKLNLQLHHYADITQNIDQNISSINTLHIDYNDKIMHETRSREINIIKSYLKGNSKLPGLIYGPEGCGKTSLLRWTVNYFEKFCYKSESDNQLTVTTTQPSNNLTISIQSTIVEPIVIVCCISRTCLSTSLQSVLVQIIEQLMTKFSIQPQQQTKSLCEYAEAVRLLNTMLNYANSMKPILIIIDDIEYLYPDEHVQMFHWLSHELPNHYIRILITTSAERIVKGFIKRFGEGCCISLSACFHIQYVMNKILPKLIQDNLKELTSQQDDINIQLDQIDEELINLALQKNITPNYIKLLAEIIAVKLSGKVNITLPENFPTDLSNLFVLRLQQIHSMLKQTGLFSAALLRFIPYIACSRIGLTFHELIEILQNDSDVIQARKRLNQVYSLQHFPIGCLKHLIYSPIYGLTKYLMFTITDNRLLITFTSESYRKGALLFWGFNANDSNYSRTGLGNENFSIDENKDNFNEKQIDIPLKEFPFHRYLSDYWLGNTSGQDDYDQQPKQTGQSYEIKVNNTEHNEDAFNTVYYWLATDKLKKVNLDTVIGTYDKRYFCNARRLTELPYQLLQLGSDSVQDLLKHVIFSFDFMLAKLLLGLRPNDVITEFYYLRQLNQLRTNDEITYLLNLLRSLSTKLSLVPTLLSVELAGRIGHLVNSEYTYIGRQLLNSIDCDSSKVNCLLPLLSICYTPPLQPELLNVKYKNNETKFFSSITEMQQQEMQEVITISSDSRFLFTLTVSQMSKSNFDTCVNSNEVLINMWEVNSLTKSCSFSLGEWPNHIFHQAYMPTHQNQLVLLTYSTKAMNNAKSGILAVNLELGCVEGNLFVKHPIQLKILCITRFSILITQYGLKENDENRIVNQEYATVYSIPNLKPISGILSKVPLPFYLSPTDRICFGPSRWPIQSKTSVEKKRKQNSTDGLKEINSNSVQVRLKNALNDVVAWIKCPLAPATFQTNIRGETLFIGCKSLGQIYRFDLTMISNKEIRIIKPNMELNLYKNIKNVQIKSLSELSLEKQTTTSFLWDSDVMNILDQVRHQVSVKKLWMSPDEKYLAALYNANDYRLIIGIWQINSRLLIAGLQGYHSSEIRFGTDSTGSFLIHFVKSSNVQTWIELAELNVIQQTQLISNVNMNRPLTNTSKSSTNLLVKIHRILAFKTSIDEAYFIRGGSLIIVTNGGIILTSVNVLILGSKNQGPMALTPIGRKLSRVNYHSELDIVYSTEIDNQQLFSYYNLLTQKIISVECTKTDQQVGFMNNYENNFLITPILEDTPCERHISSDGKRLALVYRVKSIVNDNKSDDLSRVNYCERNNEAKEYKKPKLPNINYFTSLQEKDNSSSGMGYDQTVIRLYDLDNKFSGTGLRCQISIIGEFIFHMSTKYGIYTLKPDHASNTKLSSFRDPLIINSTKDDQNKTSVTKFDDKPQALLSRYASTNGRFLGYSFLQHPVIKGTQIIFNDRYLVLCCGEHGQWIRILEAPDFNKLLYEVNLHKLLKEQDDFCRTPSVQRLFTCQAQPTKVIVQYVWLDQENSTFNVTVLDLKKKQNSELIISQMSIVDKLIDVSSDGTYGIDANLRLINFQNGNTSALLNSCNLIPGTQNEPTVLCAQFTPDKLYIVSVLYSLEYHNAWLVIIHNNKIHNNYPVIGRALLTPIDEIIPSCSTESSELPSIKIQLGYNGRLVVVKLDTAKEFKLFTIRKQTKYLNVAHSTANERIKHLLPINVTTVDENNAWSNRQKKAKYLDELITRFAESLSIKTITFGVDSDFNDYSNDDNDDDDIDENNSNDALIDFSKYGFDFTFNNNLQNQTYSKANNITSTDIIKC
ncbi:NACHT and WD repeat domain-containing 2 [Schistosoma japonicum]|nr:NACHT and WD repeat domain-containing 2 [Schistosoma japonicum]